MARFDLWRVSSGCNIIIISSSRSSSSRGRRVRESILSATASAPTTVAVGVARTTVGDYTILFELIFFIYFFNAFIRQIG